MGRVAMESKGVEVTNAIVASIGVGVTVGGVTGAGHVRVARGQG